MKFIRILLLFLILLSGEQQTPSCLCELRTERFMCVVKHACCNTSSDAHTTTITTGNAAAATAAVPSMMVSEQKCHCNTSNGNAELMASSINLSTYPTRNLDSEAISDSIVALRFHLQAPFMVAICRPPPIPKGLGSSETYLFKRTFLI